MAYNYINKSGLQYIWNKIKAKFVAKDGDKVLSDNNFTDALKKKLDGIATGANKTTVDTALSSTSTNPVQNKVINSALGGKLSTTGTAAAATKLATARTVQTNLGSATAASFDGTGNITPGITGTLTVAHGGTGATSAADARTNLGITAANIGALPSGGAAASAKKLTTGRTIRTNLGSTSTATFDGTANVTPGVTGTLPIANGGTGATTAANARSSLGITPANIGALAKSGGTVTGETIFQKGTYVHSATGTSGASGFVNIAQFSLSGTTYQNIPLELTVYRRGTTAPTYLFIEFSSANSADPGLASFKYSGYGDSTSFYMHKSATSTWQLYIKKTESYDSIGIGSYTTNFAYMNVAVTWKNVHASSAPSGSTAATYMSVGSASTATTATKLATARTIRTNLASTSTASFDGSANVTPGVTGTLPVANGGTGATTAANARSNLGIGSSATKSISSATNTRDAVAYISTDGVMEIGPYIDLHLTEDGTEDYDVRMGITSSNTTFSKPVNVASGGTGLTASPSMLTNLGSTAAANVLQASPRPGITGTLAVGHGGTGITSNPSLQVNLESGSAASVFASSPRPGVTGILPVSHGGTGVNTLNDLKEALGVSSGGGMSPGTSKISLTCRNVHSGTNDTELYPTLTINSQSNVTRYTTVGSSPNKDEHICYKFEPGWYFLHMYYMVQTSGDLIRAILRIGNRFAVPIFDIGEGYFLTAFYIDNNGGYDDYSRYIDFGLTNVKIESTEPVSNYYNFSLTFSIQISPLGEE